MTQTQTRVRSSARVGYSDACPVSILPPDVRHRWGTRCERHGTVEAWDSAAVALIACEHSVDWCRGCEREREQHREDAAAYRQWLREEFPAIGYTG